MPRFVAKKKTVESKEFATTKNILDLLEVTRRVYLSAIKFSAPIKVKIGDRLFDGATYLKAENIAEKTAIIEDPLNPNETVVKLAADLTIVSNDSTAIFCEFQFIVDTKTRKKENIRSEGKYRL